MENLVHIRALHKASAQSSTRWKDGDSWIREVHWHEVLEPPDSRYRRPGNRASQCHIAILLYRLPCRALSDARITSWNCSNRHRYSMLNSSVFQLPMWERSLDFVINRFFMKLFKTPSIEIVQLSQTYFCFELPSVLLKKRAEKFRNKYNEYHYTRCDTQI